MILLALSMPISKQLANVIKYSLLEYFQCVCVVFFLTVKMTISFGIQIVKGHFEV